MKITIARMASWLQHVSAHLPACLLALFAGWTGTFAGGAWGDSAALGHGALLVFVALYGRLGAAPSELGRRGGWLLAAFGTSLLASYLLSPVERAGRLGLLLLPAFLLVPSAVAGCWATVEQRRLGLRSWSLVVTGVAGWALFGWWQLETPRAALPLGHHNLLAAWLVITLPLAALSWREGGPGRILSGVAVLTGSAALLGTGSLGAALAVAAVGASLVLRTAWTAADAHRRRLWVASAIVVGLLLVQMPRLRQIAAGADFSATARWSYLEAGWRGLQHRPVFGWGPGAASWTISEHLRPIPGVHPPDQVVADLHCWPLQVAYEVGWSGLLLGLGLAVVFLRSRRSEAADPDLRRCALLGLAALGVVSTTGLSLAVSALPLAVVVALGAVLAAEQRSPPEPRSVGPRIAAVVAACVIGVCVLPLDRAHLAYDRAMSGLDRSQQIRHLRRAVELDPAFPLYQARLAWLEAENGLGEPAVARRALAAAEAARGLAPLWLAAGLHGQQAGEAWAS
ncbi:MAG: O-antigen ligase family protein, partial [Acidobacteriota bacterium]